MGSRFPLGARLWHKNGVRSSTRTGSRPARAPRPLTESALQELALRYVGKYATTRAKLCAYLARKLRERGWDGAREPDTAALANRFAELGYIDDAAFALGKSRSLSARGYGKRRLVQTLRQAGIEEADGVAAQAHAEAAAVEAALRFAERRRIGPYAQEDPDPRLREKWIAALIRAGHGFGLARAIAALPAGAPVDRDELGERIRLGDA
jgi:regulatory protein